MSRPRLFDTGRVITDLCAEQADRDADRMHAACVCANVGAYDADDFGPCPCECADCVAYCPPLGAVRQRTTGAGMTEQSELYASFGEPQSVEPTKAEKVGHVKKAGQEHSGHGSTNGGRSPVGAPSQAPTDVDAG